MKKVSFWVRCCGFAGFLAAIFVAFQGYGIGIDNTGSATRLTSFLAGYITLPNVDLPDEFKAYERDLKRLQKDISQFQLSKFLKRGAGLDQNLEDDGIDLNDPKYSKPLIIFLLGSTVGLMLAKGVGVIAFILSGWFSIAFIGSLGKLNWVPFSSVKGIGWIFVIIERMISLVVRILWKIVSILLVIAVPLSAGWVFLRLDDQPAVYNLVCEMAVMSCWITLIGLILVCLAPISKQAK